VVPDPQAASINLLVDSKQAGDGQFRAGLRVNHGKLFLSEAGV